MVALHGWRAGAKWELSWLPAAPLGCCTLCQWVVWELNANVSDIRRLQGYQYHYKKV